MRLHRKKIRLLLAFASWSTAVIFGAEGTDWVGLFTDDRLSGWDTWLGRPDSSVVVPNLSRNASGDYTEAIGLNRDLLNVFTVVNSGESRVLRVSGQVFGAIITKKEFINYRLRLQFRWGERRWPPRAQAPRDTGLLYRVQSNIGEPGRSFPRSLEFQIQDQDLGALYVIALRARARAVLRYEGVPQYNPRAETLEFGTGFKPAGTRCAKLANFERPHGEWNTLELVCFEDRSCHIVNGHVVMRVEGPKSLTSSKWGPVRDGRIALQSEGAEVFFRNVEIRLITDAPQELSQNENN